MGGRYDYQEGSGIDQEWAITPRVALIYKPFRRTWIKAMYSSGFRMPLAVFLNEDHYAFGAPRGVEFTKPEIMHSGELVFISQVTDALNLQLNTFYNRFENIHGLVFDPDPKVLDVGTVDFVGGEFIVTANLLNKVFSSGLGTKWLSWAVRSRMS